MKRIIKFIVVLLFIAQGNVSGQEKLQHSYTDIALKYNGYDNLPFHPAFASLTKSGDNKVYGQPLNTKPFIREMLSPDYYTKNFGFFCQKELQMEKTTKIPLRFRLGSLNYCNKLEGKQPSVTLAN